MSDITAITRKGTGTITLAEEVFSAFRTGHRGPCLTAADPGYDDARIRKNYDFCDLTGPAAQLRRIPLAAFAGYPQSYQNARVGIVLADEPGAVVDLDDVHARHDARLVLVQDGPVLLDRGVGGVDRGDPRRR